MPASRTPGPRTVLAATILHGHIHVLMVLLAGVQGLMAREFDRTHAEIGFLAFWGYLAFGLGAPPAGWLADRIGTRRVLEVTALSTCAASVLVFFSRGFLALGGSLVLLGAACSLYHPAGLGLLSRVRRRGRAFAIHGVGGSVGLAASPALAGSIAAAAGESWRAPYLAGALISLGTYGLLRWSAAEDGRPEAAEEETDHASSTGPTDGFPRLRALALALVMMTALGICYRGTLTFLPEVLGDGLSGYLPGASPVVVGGWVASLALLLGVAGQWLGGNILFHRFRLEGLFGSLLIPCLAGLLLLGLGGGWWLALGAAVFSFFFFAAQPVGNGLVAQFTPEAWRSTGYGIHFLLTFGLGSLGAWLAGIAFEAWGGGGAFLAMLMPAGFSVLVAGLLVFTTVPPSRDNG